MWRYRLINFTDKETTEIHEILNDLRGIASIGYQFVPGLDGPLDLLIGKVSSARMKERFQHAPHLDGLSVCVIPSDGPTEIWIHIDNWIHKPGNFVGTRKLYRQYLIQHETGHAIGLLDQDIKGSKECLAPCPLMYQQTLGTLGVCRSNPWISLA